MVKKTRRNEGLEVHRIETVPEMGRGWADPSTAVLLRRGRSKILAQDDNLGVGGCGGVLGLRRIMVDVAKYGVCTLPSCIGSSVAKNATSG